MHARQLTHSVLSDYCSACGGCLTTITAMVSTLAYAALHDKFGAVITATLVLILAGPLYLAIMLLLCGRVTVSFGRKRIALQVIITISFLMAAILVWAVVRNSLPATGSLELEFVRPYTSQCRYCFNNSSASN